ncbi:MAG: PhoH family protein [Rhodospirillaceae bacterium]
MTPPVKSTAAVNDSTITAPLQFEDNHLAIELFGSHHSHLARIEQKLDVAINARGNTVSITGPADAVEAACKVLTGLYERLEKGFGIGKEEVDASLRMTLLGGGDMKNESQTIQTRKRPITPRSPTQAAYIQAISDYELVFGLGPAGTGKTYLAVAKAVEYLIKGEVDRIILSRPAVEAGENLGFLPGDLREKVDPYLRPLYDALYDMLPSPQVIKRLESGEIEVAPLAFMRGRTLSNAFVILDEAQNATSVQMKMFLTRLGENARMVVTGDLSQVDLPKGTRSGLWEALEIAEDINGIGIVRFNADDVVRHQLVTDIVNAYDKLEEKRRTAERYQKRQNVNGRKTNGKRDVDAS